MSHFYKFFAQVQGVWKSHQTICFIADQKIKNYKKKLFISEVNNNELLNNCYEGLIMNTSEYFCNNSKGNTATKKHTQGTQYHYQYFLLKNKCFKVSSKSTTNNINYTEYIYLINANLLISIAFFKQLNKYLSISLTSYIKQMNK